MTYRNGELASTLRSVGYPYKVIFGLNVPQLSSIYRALTKQYPTPHLYSLTHKLWEDINVRESRLLATYMFSQDLSVEIAMNICESTLTPEEADMLAFRWLRYRNDASDILNRLKTKADTDDSCRRVATSLSRFLEE